MRHGESELSAARRMAGWSDPPLTGKGREEARRLQAVLGGYRFDGVWSSDLRRALETARLAWGEPRPDRRLRELDFGDLEEMPYTEIDPAMAMAILEFGDVRPPGGETRAQLEERLHAFLSGLAPGRHLLFVHGGVIRALTQGMGVDRFVATGTVVAVDWAQRALLFVNEPGPGDTSPAS